MYSAPVEALVPVGSEFDVSEFSARVQAAQVAMHSTGMDALLLTHADNIFYFTGYRSWLRVSQHRPFFALIPSSGSPVLLLPGLEGGNARLRSWVPDVRTWQAVDECLQHLSDSFDERGLRSATVGVELGEDMWLGMPAMLWNRIQGQMPSVNFVDASQLLWRLRRIKSPAEIYYLRQSAAACDHAVSAAWAALGDGVSERDLAAVIGKAMLDAGADEPLFLIVKAGIGVHSAGNHIATDRRIPEDEVLTLDIGCRFRGYASDMMRSATFGSPPNEIVDTYALAIEMADACLAHVKGGARIAEIDEARKDFLRKHGLPSPPYAGVGHSIGIGVHELPRIGPMVDERLEAGMVVNIEPAVRVSEFGGIAIEDTILVTDSGYEFLTQSDRSLTYIGGGA